MHVLLVEDDEDLRDVLAELIADAGHRVTRAENGYEALALLDADRPDVIVLDYMMPVMSGAAFVRAKRARPDVARIPVVLMTAARDSPELSSIAPEAFVRKPFEPEALLDRLRALGRDDHAP